MVWGSLSHIQFAGHLHASKAPWINIPINRKVNGFNWLLSRVMYPCQCIHKVNPDQNYMNVGNLATVGVDKSLMVIYLSSGWRIIIQKNAIWIYFKVHKRCIIYLRNRHLQRFCYSFLFSMSLSLLFTCLFFPTVVHCSPYCKYTPEKKPIILTAICDK